MTDLTHDLSPADLEVADQLPVDHAEAVAAVRLAAVRQTISAPRAGAVLEWSALPRPAQVAAAIEALWYLRAARRIGMVP